MVIYHLDSVVGYRLVERVCPNKTTGVVRVERDHSTKTNVGSSALVPHEPVAPDGCSAIIGEQNVLDMRSRFIGRELLAHRILYRYCRFRVPATLITDESHPPHGVAASRVIRASKVVYATTSVPAYSGTILNYQRVDIRGTSVKISMKLAVLDRYVSRVDID
jgi:hypothetical protein